MTQTFMSKQKEISSGQVVERTIANKTGRSADRPLGNAERPWHQSWPAHLPHSLSYPDVALPWILEKNLPAFAGRIAIRFLDHETLEEKQTLTYAELTARVRAVAAGLQGLGVAKGDRVGICLPNSPGLIIALHALWLAGAVAVPCNPMFSQAELAHQLSDAGASLVLGGSADVGAVARDLGLGMVWCGGQGETPSDCAARLSDWPGDMGAAPRPVEINPCEDLALILYTGGTTGSPKGAALTHRNMVVNTMQFAEWYAFEPGGETCLAVIPMFHSGGLTGVMNVPLYAGATLLVMSRFNAASMAKAVEQHRATRLFGVPTMFIALLNSKEARGCDFSSLRACRTNAAPLPPSVKAEFDALVGREVLVEGYGLTETSPLTHANPISGARAGSIGLPLTDTDAKIVDLKNGHDLSPGNSGEIVIRGPQVMKGYWNRPEETRAAIKNGWFHTGDVGVMDEQGFFTVVDRLKDMINTAGYKVWPREVEEVIYRHPAVKLVAVVGVEDDYRGEIVKAFVVPRESGAASLNAEQLISFCKENLAAYKAPRMVEFRKELPVSGVGKLLRRVLRNEAGGK